MMKTLTTLSVAAATSVSMAWAEGGMDAEIQFNFTKVPTYANDDSTAVRASVAGDFGGALSYQFDLGLTNQYEDSELGTATTLQLISPLGDNFHVGVAVGSSIVDEDSYVHAGVQARLDLDFASLEGFVVREAEEGDWADAATFYVLRASMPVGETFDASLGLVGYDADYRYARAALSYDLGNSNRIGVDFLRSLTDDEKMIRVSFTKILGNGVKFMPVDYESVFEDL